MKDPVKLKKEAFQAWLDQGPPETADRYRESIRGVASVVEAKTQVWEEFGKAMDKDTKVLASHSAPQKGTSMFSQGELLA